MTRLNYSLCKRASRRQVKEEVRPCRAFPDVKEMVEKTGTRKRKFTIAERAHLSTFHRNVKVTLPKINFGKDFKDD